MGPVGDTPSFIAQTPRGCKPSRLRADIPSLTGLFPPFSPPPPRSSTCGILKSAHILLHSPPGAPQMAFPGSCVSLYSGTHHPTLCSTVRTRLRYDLTESLRTTKSREHVVRTCKNVHRLSPFTGFLSPEPVASLRGPPPPCGVAQVCPTQGAGPQLIRTRGGESQAPLLFSRSL